MAHIRYSFVCLFIFTLLAFASDNDSKEVRLTPRENYHFGLSLGTGGPFVSLFSAGAHYLPFSHLKLTFQAGTFFIVNTYGGVVEWITHPKDPLSFSVGLGIDRTHYDHSLFNFASSGTLGPSPDSVITDTYMTNGVLRLGGDVLSQRGFGCSFGLSLSTLIHGNETVVDGSSKQKSSKSLSKISKNYVVPFFYASIGWFF